MSRPQGKMTDKEIADKICLSVTKVCKGIDLAAEEAKQGQGGQKVYIDNKEMEVDSDGKVRSPPEEL